MGTFCEAFGIAKVMAPSTARKKAQKKQKPKPRPPIRQQGLLSKRKLNQFPIRRRLLSPKNP